MAVDENTDLPLIWSSAYLIGGLVVGMVLGVNCPVDTVNVPNCELAIALFIAASIENAILDLENLFS